MRRIEVDRVLDELWRAGKAGDREASTFLNMFGPWAMRLDQEPVEILSPQLPESEV